MCKPGLSLAHFSLLIVFAPGLARSLSVPGVTPLNWRKSGMCQSRWQQRAILWVKGPPVTLARKTFKGSSAVSFVIFLEDHQCDCVKVWERVGCNSKHADVESMTFIGKKINKQRRRIRRKTTNTGNAYKCQKHCLGRVPLWKDSLLKLCLFRHQQTTR